MVCRGGEGIGVHHVDQGRGLVHLRRLGQAQHGVEGLTVRQVIVAGAVFHIVFLGKIAADGREFFVVTVVVPHGLQQFQSTGDLRGLIAAALLLIAVVVGAAGSQRQGQHSGQNERDNFFHESFPPVIGYMPRRNARLSF